MCFKILYFNYSSGECYKTLRANLSKLSPLMFNSNDPSSNPTIKFVFENNEKSKKMPGFAYFLK